MCGVVGFLTGCPMANYCVKLQSQNGELLQHDNSAEFVYKSKLRDWYDKATVRVKPRRMLEGSDFQNKLFFSPDMVPVTQHKMIIELGEQTIQEITIQHLYRYLDFTTQLEHVVVNRVAMRIANNCVGIYLPEEMIFDAYKLYIDEGYHALFSTDLKRQVRDATSVIPKSTGQPYFLRHLRKVQSCISDPYLRELVEIFFVIVSETLISSTLARIPHDSRVVSAVREVVGDHAEDEGRHHAYFASLLETMWPQLTKRQQETMGPILPSLVLSFLSPDLDSLRCELGSYGLKPNSIETILAETYPYEMIVNTRQAAKATLNYFDQNGVFEDPGTRDSFLESGLLAA